MTLPRNGGGFNCSWERCNVVGIFFPQLCQLWEREWSHRINSLKNKSKNAKPEVEGLNNLSILERHYDFSVKGEILFPTQRVERLYFHTCFRETQRILINTIMSSWINRVRMGISTGEHGWANGAVWLPAARFRGGRIQKPTAPFFNKEPIDVLHIECLFFKEVLFDYFSRDLILSSRLKSRGWSGDQQHIFSKNTTLSNVCKLVLGENC